MNETTLIGLFVAVIEFGTLLYLAALGETIAEKSGVLNLGVEGMMAMGGVTAFWAGVETGNPWVGLLVAAVAGALVASVHGLVAVVLGGDQVVSGLALTILGLGLAAFLGEDLVQERARAKFGSLNLGPLNDIPWAGEILFDQTAVPWLALALGVATWFVFTRTRVGLILRAVGESAAAADSSGTSVVKTRMIAVMIGGALAGMSGAYLTLSLAPGWSEGTTAGRGWIALALVIFGAWKPGRVGLGALLFGGLLALEPRLQTFGVEISPILLSMLPYVLTVGVLVLLSVRSRNRPSVAPAAIGLAYRREER
ncbi:MAG: ABC transporter permease [Acidimicrobiales bacterium]|nr:ABC transporter permease [Acidimicrobiales bacterium]